MDEHLLVREWTEPDSLGWILRDILPEQYVIVTDVTIRNQLLEAVVVGPQGLVVLYARDWAGEVRPTRRGPWFVLREEGQVGWRPNPRQEAIQVERALADFLRGEFPEWKPTVHHLVVLTHAEARLSTEEGADPPAALLADAADAIAAIPADEMPLDLADRQRLALALRDGQFSATQKTSEPFIFRSGGVFGSGKKAWTIRDAVEYMDRRPEDGLFHLRNGTLAEWLSDQGAGRLAVLARDVVHRVGMEPQAQLEAFLLETGLVHRPRLRVTPSKVHMGYVPAGETCDFRLRLSRGRGRGYLFGELKTTEPWLRVEPTSFSGSPAEILVTADTRSLPIKGKPWEAQILIDSSASEEPVPVLVRVVALPSGWGRYVFRPLLAALPTALLGALLGWAVGRWGLRAPAGVGEAGSAVLPWPAVWAIVVGLIWGVLGWIRGVRQPLAWTVLHALGRWLLRIASWGAALALLAAVGYWSWSNLGPSSETHGVTMGAAVLLALCMAIVPAFVAETRATDRPRTEAPDRSPGRLRMPLRPVRLAILGTLLLLLAVIVVPLLIGVWEKGDVGDRLPTIGERIGNTFDDWGERINDFIDQVRLRYQERQATPTPTPYPTRVPTITPGVAGGIP